MIIKILITLFVLFAASRAYLRFRSGSITYLALFIWLFLWGAVAFFVWWPHASGIIARSVGVGRGADALVYMSVVALFYGVFRLYVKLEFMEREITQLVRKKALAAAKKQDEHRTH
ncbi:MAG: DUF2304 family protein [Candidatus Kerfeldbacteria bacterium]|nr:DUF2304 family protein [Candidatus Kerfeldbacteria bacterium]